MAYDLLTRTLRIRHGITLIEFARAAGVSKSRIIWIEDPENPRTNGQLRLLQTAYETLIASRRAALRDLESDYKLVRDKLLLKENLERLRK